MQDILDNKNVSWKAKALYLSVVKNAKEGNLTHQDLKNMSTDGSASTAAGLKELVDSGYIVKEVLRENGRIKGTKWKLPKEPIYGMFERAQMRAILHHTQCGLYKNLIENLKPEWCLKNEKGLTYGYDEKSLLFAIDELYDKTDSAWSDMEDWKKVLRDAEEEILKELDR